MGELDSEAVVNKAPKRRAKRVTYPSPSPCIRCGNPINSATTKALAATRKFCGNQCCGEDRKERKQAAALRRVHTCSMCKQVKPRPEFGSRGRGGRRAMCLVCQAEKDGPEAAYGDTQKTATA